MKKLTITLCAILISTALVAQDIDSLKVEKTAPAKRSYFGVALGVSASTNGLGVNLNTALSKRFAFRLGYEKVDMSFKDAFSFKQSDKTFNASPQWKTGGLSAIFDFYMARSFYISAGAVMTDFNSSVKLESQDALKIGNIEFQPAEVGGLVLAIKPKEKIAPYAAIGFGRNISRDHRLTMSFEMGAYYMQSYVVDLSGSQLFEVNNDPANQGSIDNLNKTLDDISWSGIYPIVKLGISYKFIGGRR
jgi:hypothetical protein